MLTTTLQALLVGAIANGAPQDDWSAFLYSSSTTRQDPTDSTPTADPTAARNVPGKEQTWEFNVTPYLWLMGMDGDLRVDDTTVDIDVGFSDLEDNINWGLMFQAEAWKGKLGFYVNPVISQLEVEAESAGGDVDVTTTMYLTDFGVYYRFLGERTKEGRLRIADASIGGRYFYLDNEIDFPVIADVDGSTDFIDLTVGGRYGMEVTDRLGFFLQGDIGGFDLGSSSQFAWNAIGLVFWNVGKHGRLLAGYRYLYADRDKGGSTGVEMAFEGPLLGYEFSF